MKAFFTYSSVHQKQSVSKRFCLKEGGASCLGFDAADLEGQREGERPGQAASFEKVGGWILTVLPTRAVERLLLKCSLSRNGSLHG